MASGFQNIGKIPELRRRIFYTITLLAVYRIGAFVTTPWVNRAIMAKIVNQASGTFLGLFNMFSGGALEQMSIFALGIMPYISASIILQLLTVVVPKLEQIQKEGEIGRRRLNQYTRYGCVILSLIQAFFIARWLESNNRAYAQYGQVVLNPGWAFRLITMISLTTGTAFIMCSASRSPSAASATASRSSSSRASSPTCPTPPCACSRRRRRGTSRPSTWRSSAC